MKNKTIIGILLISILLVGGCSYIGIICNQFLPEEFCRIIECIFGEAGVQNMLNNDEIKNFLQTNPDAEITITLLTKKNVLENINDMSMELGTIPEIEDYIKLELEADDQTMVIFVNAENKSVKYTKLVMQKEEVPPIPPTPPSLPIGKIVIKKIKPIVVVEEEPDLIIEVPELIVEEVEPKIIMEEVIPKIVVEEVEPEPIIGPITIIPFENKS